MRVVLQRVSRASVSVGDEVVGKIDTGFVALVGIDQDDSEVQADRVAAKVIGLRVFDDADGNFNLALADVAGAVLVISQFTLHASTKKGNRPSFTRVAKPEAAIPLYEQFIATLESELGQAVKTGEFGADMKVALINDGPVTLTIDSKNRE